MPSEFVNRLRFLAAGQDDLHSREIALAADRIEHLEQEVSYGHVSYRSLVKEFGEYITDMEKMRVALRSIAANTCCDKCHEASLVARAALEGKDETARKA